MKKMTMTILTALLLVSCNPNPSPEPFIVWAPISIFVEDISGNNLLDSAFEHNILDENITVEYNRRTFTVRDTGDITIDFGLYNMGDYLGFGLFSSSDNSAEIITVNWGDGTSDEIGFEFHADKRGGHSTVLQKVWLNGELQSDNSLVVEIIK